MVFIPECWRRLSAQNQSGSPCVESIQNFTSCLTSSCRLFHLLTRISVVPNSIAPNLGASRTVTPATCSMRWLFLRSSHPSAFDSEESRFSARAPARCEINERVQSGWDAPVHQPVIYEQPPARELGSEKGLFLLMKMEFLNSVIDNVTLTLFLYHAMEKEGSEENKHTSHWGLRAERRNK